VWDPIDDRQLDQLAREKSQGPARTTFRRLSARHRDQVPAARFPDLCAAMFDWHDGHLPRYAVITDGKTSDIEVARRLHLPPGSILVFDRGYNDYLCTELTLFDVGFVTQLKETTSIRWLRPVRRKAAGSSATRSSPSEPSMTKSTRSRSGFGGSSSWMPEGKEYVFLTNRLDLAANTHRWDLLPTLADRVVSSRPSSRTWKIRTYVGTSENALHIQIWTVLSPSWCSASISSAPPGVGLCPDLVAMIRLNLFIYRNLTTWLDEPFTPPDVGPRDVWFSLAV
jgi:hypothetical protein